MLSTLFQDCWERLIRWRSVLGKSIDVVINETRFFTLDPVVTRVVKIMFEVTSLLYNPWSLQNFHLWINLNLESKNFTSWKSFRWLKNAIKQVATTKLKKNPTRFLKSRTFHYKPLTGIEPVTFGLEVQRAFLCATRAVHIFWHYLAISNVWTSQSKHWLLEIWTCDAGIAAIADTSTIFNCKFVSLNFLHYFLH